MEGDISAATSAAIASAVAVLYSIQLYDTAELGNYCIYRLSGLLHRIYRLSGLLHRIYRLSGLL